MGLLKKFFGIGKATSHRTPVQKASYSGFSTVSPTASEEMLCQLFYEPPSVLDAKPELERGLAKFSEAKAEYEYLGPYFFHPEAFVRLKALRLCVPIDAMGFNYLLVNLLADQDRIVSQAAAEALWKRQGKDFCEYAVRSVRDEMRGFTSTGHSSSDLGRQRAIRALDVLVNAAPNQDAKDGIILLIREEIE